AGGALVGVILAGSWLAGQRLGAGGRAVGGAVLLASTALAVLVPTAVVPWAAVGMIFPGARTGGDAWSPAADVGTAFGVLTALALAVIAAVPSVLRSLRGSELLAQAQRWQAATTLAITGDLAMAAGGFRPVPRIGRGWGAVRGRSSAALILRRDLVGALRTPVRAA
ncbi:hypothetical protein DZF96_17525, partial [Clavibacter michiganensis]